MSLLKPTNRVERHMRKCLIHDMQTCIVIAILVLGFLYWLSRDITVVGGGY